MEAKLIFKGSRSEFGVNGRCDDRLESLWRVSSRSLSKRSSPGRYADIGESSGSVDPGLPLAGTGFLAMGTRFCSLRIEIPNPWPSCCGRLDPWSEDLSSMAEFARR